jgi:hypothetical protein
MRAAGLLFASFLLLGACGDDADGTGGGAAGQGGAGQGGGGLGGSATAPTFDLTGAVAYALTDGDRRLYRIDAAGQVAVAVDAEVESFLPLSGGGVAVLVPPTAWVLRPSGEAIPFDDRSGWRGETADGRIVTDEALLDPASGTVEALTSPITGQVAVQEMSGDALRVDIVADDGTATAQVWSVSTDQRFDIDRCNNGEIVALSPTHVLIDDCSTDQGLLDLQSGARSPADVESLTGEQIAVSSGAVLLSQGCSTDPTGFELCLVDPAGQSTMIGDATGLDPVGTTCCGLRPAALASDGENVVVIDATGALAFRVGQAGRRTVAIGKTLVQVSMGAGGETFYVGTSGGSTVLGVLHTSDDTDSVLDDTRGWTEVRALPIE